MSVLLGEIRAAFATALATVYEVEDPVERWPEAGPERGFSPKLHESAIRPRRRDTAMTIGPARDAFPVDRGPQGLAVAAEVAFIERVEALVGRGAVQVIQ